MKSLFKLEESLDYGQIEKKTTDLKGLLLLQKQNQTWL